MIVSDYATKEVRTVTEDEDLRSCVRALELAAVGCVLVVDSEGRAVGILTDRDVTVRAIAGHLEGVEKLPAHQFMSDPLVCVEPDAPVEEAVKRMRTEGCRRLPVCVDGTPVGILSLDDILDVYASCLHDISSEMPARQRRELKHARVSAARGELEDIYDDVREKLKYTSWYSREVLLDEIEAIKARLRKAVDAMDMHLP